MTDAGSAASPPSIDAGAWLRYAREQAGLSIDAVAQQLKLAPRQVRALEDGTYADLPGRTFVRGFVRNYARLLKLDPEEVVAALPDADAVPGLGGPSIGSSARPMGELPATHSSRGSSWSRWAIPLALAAAVALAAFYEWTRTDEAARTEAAGAIPAAGVDGVAPPPASGLPLPNPASGADPSGETLRPDAPPREGAPDTNAAAPTPPVTAAPATLVQSDSVPGTPGVAPAAAAAPGSVRASAPEEAVLVIRYRANAWTQVKDATGQVLLVTNGKAGTTQSVAGRPPLDIVIGNATEASITWRGEPFDLGPHVRANNIARARLP